jgi:hypothetical protein
VPEETTNGAIGTTAAIATGAVRTLPGVEPAVVAAFVEALTSAAERLGGISSRLEAARVHDRAFGKLIDAAKVRDAYHERLPATEHNLAEARDVIDHFLAEFTGGEARGENVAESHGEAA